MRSEDMAPSVRSSTFFAAASIADMVRARKSARRAGRAPLESARPDREEVCDRTAVHVRPAVESRTPESASRKRFVSPMSPPSPPRVRARTTPARADPRIFESHSTTMSTDPPPRPSPRSSQKKPRASRVSRREQRRLIFRWLGGRRLADATARADTGGPPDALRTRLGPRRGRSSGETRKSATRAARARRGAIPASPRPRRRRRRDDTACRYTRRAFDARRRPASARRR